MTTAKMLENALRASEWLRDRSHGNPPIPPTHVLIEWSAALKHLAATWRPPGEEAGIAVRAASIAARELQAMATPAEHARQLSKRRPS